MKQTTFIYRVFTSSMLMVAGYCAEAQFATKAIDYLPAPGQYTNADFTGTPDAANSIVGTNKGLVSLGAFGGSVTVYFSDGIKNDPGNPYGVDFTIYGNATSTWAEPGIVQVMKDENKNGIPDDTWYEIAGSDHWWDTTIFDYEVTYLNNGLTKAGDTEWQDNKNSKGIIPENSFHQQPYYPRSDYFPSVTRDKYILKGTRLMGQIDLSNPGVVNSYRRVFGYADNTPVLSHTDKLPDNPYTSAIEGSGGDAIDISWAVDQNRRYVQLDEINFIRIYTGMNTLAGWLGEISTEITGIRDVEPAYVDGVTSIVVIQDLPLKVSVGESVFLNTKVFESGIVQENALISWSVNKPELAIIENGQLVAKKAGAIRIRATSIVMPDIYAEKVLEIIEPAKAKISLSSNSLKVNDKLELLGKFTDQNDKTIAGVTPHWRLKNELFAELTSFDGKFYLSGKQPGQTWLYLEAADMKSISDSVLIEILPESVRKKVFISVKTTDHTIIARQPVWVDQVDLTSKVDRNQKLYGLQEISYVSLAHAIAAVFENTTLGSEWVFRDDAEGGSKLYLWKVPELEDGSVLNTFGYGGSQSADAYRKTWVVMLNQQSFVNDFDQIKINNNDEILIYHIPYNSLPWLVTQLTCGSDTIKPNQSVEIQMKQYTCTMDVERAVAVNSSVVLADQIVEVTQNDLQNTKIVLTTDEFGKASFSTNNSGEFEITSGIDASRLIVESVTGNHIISKNKVEYSVWPNPFIETIRIDCPFVNKFVAIYNVQGQLVYSQNDPSNSFGLGFLPSGIYVMKVISGTQVFQQKIVKK